MKGILKITSLEKYEMEFISDDGELEQPFLSSKEDFRKWFCNSSLEQAKIGVRATYDGKNNLMTNQWDTRRRAQSMSGMDFKLSHHFC